MINKRGLSPDEFENLDPNLLEYLMIFDSVIEPSGTVFEMQKFAYAQYNSFCTNPNFDKQTRKDFKVQDFDFLNILNSPRLTTKEQNDKRIEDKKIQQSNDIAKLGKTIKELANGRK